MGFFVIADDGNKYGPADLATLNAWIAEGRLQPNTILEEVQTMERRPASTVPGLNFPGAQAHKPRELTPTRLRDRTSASQTWASREATAISLVTTECPVWAVESAPKLRANSTRPG